MYPVENVKYDIEIRFSIIKIDFASWDIRLLKKLRRSSLYRIIFFYIEMNCLI